MLFEDHIAAKDGSETLEIPLPLSKPKQNEEFELTYEQKFEKTYEFFRPFKKNAIYEYLSCGDLENGFGVSLC